MFYRLLFSDSDYQKIASESPLIWNNWEIKTRSFGDSEIINELFSDLENAQGLEKLNTYYASIPFVKINPDVKSLFDFQYEDFELVGYDPHPHIKAEVSV